MQKAQHTKVSVSSVEYDSTTVFGLSGDTISKVLLAMFLAAVLVVADLQIGKWTGNRHLANMVAVPLLS